MWIWNWSSSGTPRTCLLLKWMVNSHFTHQQYFTKLIPLLLQKFYHASLWLTFKETSKLFSKWLYNFIFYPAMYEGYSSSTSFTVLKNLPFWLRHSSEYEKCISRVTNVQHLLLCLLDILIPLRNVYSNLLPLFSVELYIL